MSSYSLKAYVGIKNRFVFCEEFPKDEHHAGLEELLNDFMEDDIYLVNYDLEPGFYLVTLFTQYDTEWTPDSSNSDVYLEVSKVEKL